MNKFLICLLAVSALVSGCAAVEPGASTASSDSSAKPAKEEHITGSRLPRQNAENYQGVKGMDRRDYEQYKAPTGRADGN